MEQLVLGLLAIVALGLFMGRAWWSGRFVRALVEGRVGPTLLGRMDEVLEPYEGIHLDAEELGILEGKASEHFLDLLASEGLVLPEWRLVLRDDDVLGPRCFVVHRAGRDLSLVEFDLALREGRLDAGTG